MAPNIGFGVQLQRSDDGTSGGPFSTVGIIHKVTAPSISREAVDVTSHSSPERWREYIAGMKDGGEFSLDIEYDPGSAYVAAFLAEINADTIGFYKMIFPDAAATEWGFAALVTSFDADTPMEDKMTASITGKLTGKPGFIV